jgi:thiol-disulfide isomerase/thioredoxin
MRRPSFKVPTPQRLLTNLAALLLLVLVGLSGLRSAVAEDIAKLAQEGGLATSNPADANHGVDHPLSIRRPAPALEGGTQWLNTHAAVELKDLRGKFVVLDFWTYCCINCMHVLPELKKLEKAYPNNVVVIGVHSGKFDTEHDAQSIRQAIKRYEIEHPVVNDADYKIWRNYGCRSWPSLRVIDPVGNLVASHSGEIDFAVLDAYFKQNLPIYRDKGLLNERPIDFGLESDSATQTQLCYPGKVLADEASGRLFIADTNHNRIVATSLDGMVLAVIGEGKIGKSDGDFATTQFNHPQGMALRSETLYVADTENHLLRKVDLKNQRVATIAGTGQQAHPELLRLESSERFGGPPLTTSLTSPWALRIDGYDLFIAMAGAHQIWRMPLDESKIGPYAGNGREDIRNGALLPRLSSMLNSSSFAQPSGLSSDGKRLFVADSEGSSVRAVPLDAADNVTTIIGTAALDEAVRLFTFGDVDGLPGKARLQHCLDVTYHDGRLYVADTYNHKIKLIDLNTRECTTLAGTGKAGNADGSATQSAEFFEPAGVSYAAGKLYVADTNNHLIRVVDLINSRVSTLRLTGL